MKSTTTHELSRHEVDEAVINWLEVQGALGKGVPKVSLSTRGYTTVTVLIDTQVQEEAPRSEPLDKPKAEEAGEQTDMFPTDAADDAAEDALENALDGEEEEGTGEDFGGEEGEGATDEHPLPEDTMGLDTDSANALQDSEFD